MEFEKSETKNALAKLSPFIYLLLITAAELLVIYNPNWGLFLHGIIMFTLFGHASFLYPDDKTSSYLFMAIALAPLIRIVSLFAPLAGFHFLYWFVVLSIPLFFASFLLISFQHLDERDVGLVLEPRQIPLQLAIVLTGIPFGYIEYFILTPHPLILDLSFRSLFVPSIIMLVCTGLMEELIFRGIIQHNAIRYFNPGIGIFFTSVLFAIMHIGNWSVLNVIFVFFLGYFWGYCMRFTGSIIGISISHGVTNILLFLIMPLLS
ncbi:CPBP family intramembrane metalloprotease [candidate division NPL-UPA2 bacterium]|nr:CPBP family intramembrane metalloprotease [candidate division NPL-UPA2 bacterium]